MSSDYVIDLSVGGVTTRVTTVSQTSSIAVILNPNVAVALDVPIIASSSVPDGTQNTAYTATLNVIGGFGPYTWSLTSGTLPVGLSLSSAGVLSGTPPGVQTNVTFVISVSDSLGHHDSKSFTMSVAAAPTTTFGPHLGDWMVQSGDQVLILPDGTYDGANINAAASVHAATTGTYKGWLVLQAQNKGGAVIDLSSTGFRLGTVGAVNRTYRILFVGMNFVNGDVQLHNSNAVGFWHCDFTYPSSAYQAQYAAAGNNTNNMVNPQCRGLDLVGELAVGSPYNNNIWAYGCTFHDIANDAVYSQGTSNLKIVGCQFWNIFHHLAAPWSVIPFHSDAIQLEWGSNGTITDNFIGGHIQAECHDSGLTNWTLSNNWHAGSAQDGIIFDPMNHSFSNFVVTSSRWWAMGQYQNGNSGFTSSPQYDSGWDVLFIAFPSVSTVTPPSGVTVSSITHSVPSGITVSGGLISDLPGQATARSHASNPAVVWATTNTYSTWPTFFASRWV